MVVCLAAFTAVACGKPGNDKPGEDDGSGPFVSKSYNGDIIQAVAEAYKEFEETDEMGGYANVQGIKYMKSRYIGAVMQLIPKMVSDPDHWQDEDIEIPVMSPGSDTKNNTFDPNVISFDDVVWAMNKMMEYADAHGGSFPNYVTFPTKYTEDDGTQHDNKLTFTNLCVIIGRVISEYVKECKFPDEVSSWQSDFLRKTTNCAVGDPVVKAAMDAALKGVADTPRAKAEALFNYSRDEWEWEDYMNTKKGSVKTIEAKGGNCCDLSHALVAMCRTAGLPARYMHGQCQYSSVIGHVFVEIWVDGKWYICDPSNNSNTFGKHNWSHMVTFNGRYKTLPF